MAILLVDRRSACSPGRRWPPRAPPRGGRGRDGGQGGPLRRGRQSALFAAATTGTSTGRSTRCTTRSPPPAAASTLFNMMLGEIAPGGVGSGLYGMLMLAVVTVFLCGLMVGRTPEYLGKKIGQREIVLVALYVLATPFARPGRHRPRAHRDARARRAAGVRSARPLRGVVRRHLGVQQQRLGLRRPHLRHPVLEHAARASACSLGRFLPIVFVLALAGRFAAQHSSRQRRHPAHPPAALRRPAHRRRRWSWSA